MSENFKRDVLNTHKMYLDGGSENFSEDVLAAFTPEIWALYANDSDCWRKRVERNSRCLVEGENGKPKRCTDDCHACPHVKGYGNDPDHPRPGERSGSVLSLEFAAENGMQFPSFQTPDKLTGKRELRFAVRKAIAELENKLDRRIAALWMKGMTERNIAKKVGRDQSTVNYRKKGIRVQLREKLKDFR